MEQKSTIKTTRMLTETAIMIALATALSYIQIPKLMGGSITLFSQVPIIILGYRYGWKNGCFAGIVHGLLQMLLQGLGNFAYVKGLPAYLVLIFADYVFAFMSLGLGGSLFRKMKNQTLALGLGAVTASALRFLCHFISGVTIWGDYAGGAKSVWLYSLTYNGSYMAFELILSVIGVAALSLVLDFSKENLRKTRKTA
jgi:thiamine transporter